MRLVIKVETDAKSCSVKEEVVQLLRMYVQCGGGIGGRPAKSTD